MSGLSAVQFDAPAGALLGAFANNCTFLSQGLMNGSSMAFPIPSAVVVVNWHNGDVVVFVCYDLQENQKLASTALHKSCSKKKLWVCCSRWPPGGMSALGMALPISRIL